MTVLLDSEDIVDLAQKHIEAVCMGGLSGRAFFPNIVSGRKISASVKQYMIASGSIVERYDGFIDREKFKF